MKTIARQGCQPRSGMPGEHGFVLIAALMVLLMLTMLSVSMFRSLGLEERITGNTREKQHAFFAAQSALQSAENWLSSGNASQGTACSMTSPTPKAQICTLATTPSPQNLATTPWSCTFGTTYVPPAIVVQGTLMQQLVPQTNCAGATSPGTVYMDPQFAIAYLGQDPASPGAYLYQVTSLGYGGNQNAMAVVQSVYSVGGGGAQQVSK
jgi:type IV pilus assembly protein PilX